MCYLVAPESKNVSLTIHCTCEIFILRLEWKLTIMNKFFFFFKSLFHTEHSLSELLIPHNHHMTVYDRRFETLCVNLKKKPASFL